MTFAYTAIAIAGTHSTGKSTFLSEAKHRLEATGFRVGMVADVASKARDLGFPILREHVYESTLWIIAEGIRQEMEAALMSDVVLVDRPSIDAIGYLLAALNTTGREEPRLPELRKIAEAHMRYYDWFGVTVLNENIPLGADRDPDQAFRKNAGDRIAELASEVAPEVRFLTTENREELLTQIVQFVNSRKMR